MSEYRMNKTTLETQLTKHENLATLKSMSPIIETQAKQTKKSEICTNCQTVRVGHNAIER